VAFNYFPLRCSRVSADSGGRGIGWAWAWALHLAERDALGGGPALLVRGLVEGGRCLWASARPAAGGHAAGSAYDRLDPRLQERLASANGCERPAPAEAPAAVVGWSARAMEAAPAEATPTGLKLCRLARANWLDAATFVGTEP